MILSSVGTEYWTDPPPGGPGAWTHRSLSDSREHPSSHVPRRRPANLRCPALTHGDGHSGRTASESIGREDSRAPRARLPFAPGRDGSDRKGTLVGSSTTPEAWLWRSPGWVGQRACSTWWQQLHCSPNSWTRSRARLHKRPCAHSAARDHVLYCQASPHA